MKLEAEMFRMNQRVPLRFFVVTFLWSWLLWMPLVLAGFGVLDISEHRQSMITMPLIILGAFGPAVGAIYSIKTLEGSEKVQGFLQSFLSLYFSLKLWLAIFFILGCINFIAWYVPELLGYDRAAMLLPGIFIFPLYWLYMVVLGGGQEEIGWRGYILPYMESRYGLWAGNVILGLLWAAWHIPLWWISGATQAFMPFAAFVIGLVGLSFFLSWVLKKSNGKPLSAVIAHGTFNAFIPVFPTIIMEFEVFQLRFWMHEILLLCIGVILMWRWAKQRKRGRTPSD